MKNSVFIYLFILTFGCTSIKGVLGKSKRASKVTQKKVIQFDKFSRMATIGSVKDEKVQSVYLYDKERNLIKSFEGVKVNRFMLSVQGVYFINVVTNKGLHIKVLESGR